MAVTLLSFSSVEDVSTIISAMSQSSSVEGINTIIQYQLVSSSVEGIGTIFICVTGRASLQKWGLRPINLSTRICWIHQGTWLLASAQHTRASNAPLLPWVKARFAPRTAPLTEGPIGGTAGGPN